MAFNLDEYRRRIDYRPPSHADSDTLAAVHRAHVLAIPFENLDIQMGRPIRLDGEALQAKMVRQRRGGYCFEQNALFAMALGAMGFTVEPLEARVRQQDGGVVRPRTHMVLRVAAGGRLWLADAGFGGDGLLEPVPFDSTPIHQLGVPYRVAHEGRLAILQRRLAGGWEDLYAILPDAVHPADYEVGNWFTSTYPRSPFVLNLTAQRITDGARHILRNLTYAVTRGTRTESREIARGELASLLRDTFGLDVPDAARFRAIDEVRT
jgi:N-hydroxyarylamine O-acetyltransferase